MNANERPSGAMQTYTQLQRYAEDLKSAVQDLRRSRYELESAYLDTIHRLSLAVEYKDEDTGAHVVRLSRCSGELARLLGQDDDFTRRLEQAAPMHDVGKIGIPDAILLKPAELTPGEFETMKTHTTIGANLLQQSRSAILECGRVIALTHHEKWNGSGYPAGLAGTDIPLEGRIVGLMDVFDALLSRRPYKEPFPMSVAVSIIRENIGAHFDPDIGRVFLDNVDLFREIREQVDARGVALEDFTCMEWDVGCTEALLAVRTSAHGDE